MVVMSELEPRTFCKAKIVLGVAKRMKRKCVLSLPLRIMRRKIHLVIRNADRYTIRGRLVVLVFITAIGDVKYFVGIDNEMFGIGFEIGIPVMIFVECVTDLLGDVRHLIGRDFDGMHSPLFDPRSLMLLRDGFDICCGDCYLFEEGWIT